MLQSQVNYWNLQETRRHNLATERLARESQAETQRHNISTEDVAYGNLRESATHNRATEALGWETLGENRRHNVVAEYENERHNREMEGIQQAANAEAIRSHKAQEEISWYNAETANKRLEYDALNAASNSMQAQVAWQNAETNKRNAETQWYRAQLENLDLQRKITDSENAWKRDTVSGIESIASTVSKIGGVVTSGVGGFMSAFMH